MADFKLYFCVGCRQVHHDMDYCKEDGDLEITNWSKFLESVDKVKTLFERGGKN